MTGLVHLDPTIRDDGTSGLNSIIILEQAETLEVRAAHDAE